MRSRSRNLAGLLGFGSRRFTAVDFDSRHLRIVLAEYVRGRTKILKLAQVDMPAEMDLSDTQAVGEFLGQAMKDQGLSGGGVLMNVPRGQAVLKPLTLPPGTQANEMAAMVQFQVEKELPFPPQDAVIDFTVASHFDAQTAEGAARGVDVLVAAVRLVVVDQYRRIAEAAGTHLLRLGLRPYASLQCVQACQAGGQGEPVAVVNLTADEAEINVVTDGSLAFSRSAVLSILPRKGGSDPAVKETVDSLVTEVTRSLQSYQTVQGGKGITAVVLAGGTGLESRAAQNLAERLGVRCEILPTVRVIGSAADAPGTSAFVSALGLVIGHHSASLPLDFLNPKRPVVKRDLRKVRLVGGVTIAALSLLTVITVVSGKIGEKRDYLARLQNDYKKAQDEAKKVKALAKRVEAIDDWVKDNRNWLDHWAHLSCLFPSCKDVYISDLKVNRTDGSFNFTLKARDSQIATELRKKVEEAGYEFQLGQTSTIKDRYGYLHATEVKILTPPRMEMNLASLEPPARPSDDASLEQFLRTHGEAGGDTGTTEGEETQSPAKPAGETSASAPATPATAPAAADKEHRAGETKPLSEEAQKRAERARLREEQARKAREERDKQKELDRSRKGAARPADRAGGNHE